MPDLSMIGINDSIKLDNLSLAAVVSFCGKQSEIQRLTEIKHWRHVASSDNPADILSRGLSPYDIMLRGGGMNF